MLETIFLAILLGVVNSPPASTAVIPAPPQEGPALTDDGVELFYRVVGNGAQVVVIPVAVWLSPHLDALATPGRRVVYYDPRGRGRSGLGDLEAASLDRAVRDLELLRKHLRIERMALVGWSGYGLEMAAYALQHPDRVSRLIQLNPVPPRQEPYMSARTAAMRARIDTAAWKRFQDLAATGADPAALCRSQNRAMAPAFFARPEAAFPTIDRVCEWRNEWAEQQGAFFEAFLPSLAKLDLGPPIRALRIPRLVIHGDRDLIPLDGVREWLTGGENVRLLVIAGADHGSFLDAPDVVIPAIDRFLSGEWPAGATVR